MKVLITILLIIGMFTCTIHINNIDNHKIKSFSMGIICNTIVLILLYLNIF